MDSQDIVKFQGMSFEVPTGHTEAEIRAAVSDSAPAIENATLNKVDNGDGTFTWNFTERAGTKGC